LWAGAAFGSQSLPFSPGERLYYELKWTIVIAGRAVAEVSSAELSGRPMIRLSAKGRTTQLIDIFYKVRDRVSSFVGPKFSRSLLYLKKQKEGRFVRDEVVRFDHEKGLVTYQNFGKKREPLKIPGATFDPLAAAYYARTLNLRVGKVYRVWVTDGKRLVPGSITVRGKERIKTKAGRFDTLVVVPDIREVRGVFKKSPGAKVTIWVTDDAKKIPVMIKSKVVVGYFLGELAGMEGVDGYPDLLPEKLGDFPLDLTLPPLP
jgi:hypothetical protein